MFNFSLVTPFQNAKNSFKLDLFVNHFINELNKQQLSYNPKSYYLGKNNVSFKKFIKTDEDKDGYYKFINSINLRDIKKLREDLVDYKEPKNTFGVFKEECLSSNTLKLSINRKKIDDNKTFMENLIKTIFSRFKIPLEQIYGIIALDSKNNGRLLNLTHAHIAKLVSNGFIPLDNYDEFYIFVYNDIVCIPKYELKEDDNVKKITDDLFSQFLYFWYNDILQRVDVTDATIFIFDNPFEQIESYNTKEKKNFKGMESTFVPTHFIKYGNIYPYYGYNFIIKKDGYLYAKTPYDLRYFLTGNIGDFICTGSENVNTFYGLTTLEGYNTDSEFIPHNLVINDGSSPYNPIFKFVQTNVKLSLMEYIKKEEYDTNKSKK